MLSLITDLFGPIFAKEMVEMSRRWRYYQNRIFFGSVVLLVLFVVYQENRYVSTIRGTSTLRDLSKMAETFFLSYLWVQYLAVFLFVPFFLTGVISGEREQKTLDLLFTTQLNDRDIVYGKLGSRVVSMLLIIFSGVPIVALTMLFGGVNLQVFFYGMIATLLAVLYTSSFAIYFSTVTKTTLGALVRTYWWMICWILIVPLILVMGTELILQFGSSTGMSAATRQWWQSLLSMAMCLLNPVAPFVVGTNDFLAGRLMTEMGSWYFYYLLIIPILWSLLLIFLAIRNIRREPGPRKFAISMRKVIRTIGSILIMKPLTARLVSMLPKGKADQFFWMPIHNPLWQRTRRAWVYDREQHLQRAQLGGWLLVIIVLAGLFFLESHFFSHGESAVFFMAWIWLGLAIIASLVGGISIINDRRKGFFEFVLVTPLEHWEVILGTFLGCWRHIKKLYLLTVIMTIFFMCIQSITVIGGLASITIGTLAIMLAVLHGIACSLVARNLAAALIASFTLPLMTLILPPLISTMFRQKGPAIFWLMSGVLLTLSFLLLRWRKNAFTVALFLCMMHLSFACLVTCWVNTANDYNLPLMAIHPGVHIFEPMLSYRYSRDSRYGMVWSTLEVLYAMALALNMLWLFWWLCRHYEVLSGRKEQGRTRMIKPQVTSTALSLAKVSSQ